MKWVKVKVVPCLKYDFKIVVQSHDQKKEIHESSVKHLGPVDKEAIDKSSYDPEMPKFVGAHSVGSKTELKYKASPCVDSYELFIKEDNENNTGQDEEYDGNGKNLNITSENKTLIYELTDLKPCTEYETILSAKINGRYNQEVETHNIMTNPDKQTAENIELKNLKSGTNDVSFALAEPWKPKLTCIKDYQIQICSNDEGCFDTFFVNQSTENPFWFETTRKGLTPCTDYNLTITPMHKDVTIQSKSFPFKTLSDTNSTCPIVQPNGKST